jgi:hypothetical protein
MAYSKENYERTKAARIIANNKWRAKQGDEFKDYLRGLIRTSTQKHYYKNQDKISDYKKQHYQWKKEVARLMNLYSVYE